MNSNQLKTLPLKKLFAVVYLGIILMRKKIGSENSELKIRLYETEQKTFLLKYPMGIKISPNFLSLRENRRKEKAHG